MHLSQGSVLSAPHEVVLHGVAEESEQRGVEECGELRLHYVLDLVSEVRSNDTWVREKGVREKRASEERRESKRERERGDGVREKRVIEERVRGVRDRERRDSEREREKMVVIIPGCTLLENTRLSAI